MRRFLVVASTLAMTAALMVPAAPAAAAEHYDCDVLIVGGSTGGVAAAVASARRGVHTCLVSTFDTLGGQFTTQAISAPDEGFRQFPGSYDKLFSLVQDLYRLRYPASPTSADFNPGRCWVSRLCGEPNVFARAMEDLIGQYVADHSLQVFRGWAPESVQVTDGAVSMVEFVPSYSREFSAVSQPSGARLSISAPITVDATDLGDLLPLAGAEFTVGDSTRFSEPDATDDPACVQPFTYSFFLERSGAPAPKVPAPSDYDPSRYGFGAWDAFASQKTFANGVPMTFWTYRRVHSSEELNAPSSDHDVALINWGPGNDFNQGCGPGGCDILSSTDPEATLAAARDLALGFAHWLQNDAPHDDSSAVGFPDLRLRPDLTNTVDGLSVEPYWREGRHMVAVDQVTEQEIAARDQRNPSRSPSVASFTDSVGIGRYFFDLHPCVDGTAPNLNVAAGAFQIPLSALVPVSVDGLLAGSKNLGVTHITNGTFRLHPVEWTVGTAAGALAADAVKAGVSVRAFLDGQRLRKLQFELLTVDQVTLYWWGDMLHPPADASRNLLEGDDGFLAAEMLAVMGVTTRTGDGTRPFFDPDTPASSELVATWTENLFGEGIATTSPDDLAAWLFERTGILSDVPVSLTRRTLAQMLWDAVAPSVLSPAPPPPTDPPPSRHPTRRQKMLLRVV